MADHHEAKDALYRRTYRHALGRPLHSQNSGAMQWGDTYRRLHVFAWAEARRVLRAEGLLLLNVKDHQRSGRRMPVCEWYLTALATLGFGLLEAAEVPAPGFRYGTNRERYPEMLYMLQAFCGVTPPASLE